MKRPQARAMSTPGLGVARRGVIAIAGGTAAGQFIAALSAPALARLFSPSDFGTYSVVLALAASIGSVAALKFDAAIPVAGGDSEVQSLTVLALSATAVTGLASTILVASLGPYLADAVGSPQLTKWLWAVPPLSVMTGLFLLLHQLAIRHRRYSASAKRVLLQSITTVAAQLGAGVLRLGTLGLLAGYGAGQLVGVLSLARHTGVLATPRRARSARRLLAVARSNRRFSMLLAPAGLINAVGLHLPVLLIAALYGPEDAGWLGMTQRIIALPVALIGSAVSQVYLGEFAHAIREDYSRASILFWRASRGLLLTGCAVAAVLALLGPWLFLLVLGEDWGESGEFARASALLLAAQMVASPLAATLVVTGHQRAFLLCDLARLIFTATPVVAVARLGGSALDAVWALSTGGATAYVLYWFVSRRSLRTIDPRKA